MLTVKDGIEAIDKHMLDHLISISTDMEKAVYGLPQMETIVVNPVNGLKGTLLDTVASLNDNERWTREEIADWIDSLEETGLDMSFEKGEVNEQD